jgi:hypothetical protein
LQCSTWNFQLSKFLWNFQRHNVADVKCGVIDVELQYRAQKISTWNYQRGIINVELSAWNYQRGIFNVEFSTWNFQRGIFNVATLQRCNVELNTRVLTALQRCNVAMLQCCNVAMLQCCNVAMDNVQFSTFGVLNVEISTWDFGEFSTWNFPRGIFHVAITTWNFPLSRGIFHVELSTWNFPHGTLKLKIPQR